jgi:N-acetylneuraminic acid mutarotase
VAVVGSGDGAQLWMLNGVKYHDADATAAANFDTGAASAALKAYRYTRAGGWTDRGSLPAFFPLYGAATAATATQIWCFGGYTSAGVRLRDVYAVDAASGQIVPGALQLPAADNEDQLAIANGVAATIGDKIYVTAGEAHEAGTDENGNPSDNGLAATLVFNPATKAFEAPLPGPTHPYKSMASAVVGGKWYTFGGFFATNTPVADAQAFDPVAGTWSMLKPMPTARYGAAAAVLDGKIWVVGGETLNGAPCRAVEVYDPANDAWTRRAPLRWPSSYPAAVGVGGKIVVAGGVAGASDTGFPLPLRSTQTEELTP